MGPGSEEIDVSLTKLALHSILRNCNWRFKVYLFCKKCLRNFRAVILHFRKFKVIRFSYLPRSLHKGNKKGKIFQSLRKKQATNVTYSFYLKRVSLICYTKVYVCTTRNVFENGYKTYRYNLNISKVTYIQYIKQCIVIPRKQISLNHRHFNSRRIAGNKNATRKTFHGGIMQRPACRC